MDLCEQINIVKERIYNFLFFTVNFKFPPILQTVQAVKLKNRVLKRVHKFRVARGNYSRLLVFIVSLTILIYLEYHLPKKTAFVWFESKYQNISGRFSSSDFVIVVNQ